jgi:hypothetical protein
MKKSHRTRSSAPCCRTFEEVLRYPTLHHQGNAVSLFTRNGAAAQRFISEVAIGMVGVKFPMPVRVGYYSHGGWNDSAFADLNQYGKDSIRFFTRVPDCVSAFQFRLSKASRKREPIAVNRNLLNTKQGGASRAVLRRHPQLHSSPVQTLRVVPPPAWPWRGSRRNSRTLSWADGWVIEISASLNSMTTPVRADRRTSFTTAKPLGPSCHRGSAPSPTAPAAVAVTERPDTRSAGREAIVDLAVAARVGRHAGLVETEIVSVGTTPDGERHI